MKLEPELLDAFMAEAEAAHRPASQIMRELMREFLERQRQSRDYDAFLNEKVQRARSSVQANKGRTNEEVEKDFAAKRAKAMGQVR